MTSNSSSTVVATLDIPTAHTETLRFAAQRQGANVGGGGRVHYVPLREQRDVSVASIEMAMQWAKPDADDPTQAIIDIPFQEYEPSLASTLSTARSIDGLVVMNRPVPREGSTKKPPVGTKGRPSTNETERKRPRDSTTGIADDRRVQAPQSPTTDQPKSDRVTLCIPTPMLFKAIQRCVFSLAGQKEAVVVGCSTSSVDAITKCAGGTKWRKVQFVFPMDGLPSTHFREAAVPQSELGQTVVKLGNMKGSVKDSVLAEAALIPAKDEAVLPQLCVELVHKVGSDVDVAVLEAVRRLVE